MINDITSKMSLLVLQDVGADHTGSYECHAYNPVGRATYSAVLKVNGTLIAGRVYCLAFIVHIDLLWTSITALIPTILASLATKTAAKIVWKSHFFSTEKPEILPFDFPSEVKEGQLLQLSCTVTTGDDPVTLQWYKDDMPIISSAKFMINKVDSKMSFLILRDVGLDHTGTYTCLAFNPVGQQKFSAQLWVNGNNA